MKRKSNPKKAGIDKIKATFKELTGNGEKATQGNVAQALGISKQSVSKTLNWNNESTTKFRFTEQEISVFIAQLKSMETATKSLNDLKQLVGYPRSKQAFNKLLRKHGIPFSDSRFSDSVGHNKVRPGGTRHKLLNLKVDISTMTIQELHKLIDCKATVESLRVICHRHKIQYKKVSHHV